MGSPKNDIRFMVNFNKFTTPYPTAINCVGNRSQFKFPGGKANIRPRAEIRLIFVILLKFNLLKFRIRTYFKNIRPYIGPPGSMAFCA